MQMQSNGIRTILSHPRRWSRSLPHYGLQRAFFLRRKRCFLTLQRLWGYEQKPLISIQSWCCLWYLEKEACDRILPSLGTRVECDKWLCLLETWKVLWKQSECCAGATTPPCKVLQASVKKRSDSNAFNLKNNLSVGQTCLNSTKVDLLYLKN